MANESETKERVGVLLFNLGGPESIDQVKPFLYNLFSDPDIIRLPWRPMQKPLAWIIATTRNRKSSGYYKKIGGGSPLRKITDQQAAALQAALAAEGVDAGVYVGMRYWNPLIEDALSEIKRDNIQHLIVLPLYPQYSIATTGSSLNRMKELLKPMGLANTRLSIVNDYYDYDKYIEVLAESVREQFAQFPDGNPYIVFSAHSVPVSYIEGGDPYLDQTRKTVELVMEKLGPARQHILSFQSKVGPVKWLGPSTDEIIRRLASEGVKRALLVPVSFVSEHIETLYELDILYRDVAREVGLAEYRRVPALNCRQEFIDVLARLVLNTLRNGDNDAVP